MPQSSECPLPEHIDSSPESAGYARLTLYGPKDESSDTTVEFVFQATFPSYSPISEMLQSGCPPNSKRTWFVPIFLGPIESELLLQYMTSAFSKIPPPQSLTPLDYSWKRVLAILWGIFAGMFGKPRWLRNI